MEYKNNMLKLPVYIPNYNISNNQETEKKTDKKYKYTYVNIDSLYRQTENVYEYSQYYYLDYNPFILNQNKTEIKLKLKQEYTNDFKNYDKITIEHIQPVIMIDFFNKLITIQNNKAIFNDLPEQLKFTNSDSNYFCTIQFDNVELQNNNENINSLFNFKKIYFLNDRYYLKISKDLNIFNSYNFSNVKVKIMFFYTYNIDYNTLEVSNKTNINFHTITKEKDYLIIKLNKGHNFIVNENNEEFYFGGQNVMIRKINNIALGYQNTNYYKYELKEQINNIVGIKIINSSFPCYINNITSNKNKLYFKTYNNVIVYNIQLENGYYSADLLQKTIKNKINNMKDFNFSSLTSNALNEMYSSLGVKNDNGNYYIESIRTNADNTYMISEITLKENKDNKIIYNVESKYCANGDKSNCKDVASVNNDFIIIKENNNYKVDSFILPD